ncbi:LOW QUALITY PROTEIN: hypothetical protein TorRG33x02_099550 [Trema orientale]|uniref:Uncharacterized protein n=1 Tax=Trema orientale TaxID=63057 RepID=A0A2P5F8V3_TREOI|nr:LOW QUALITY PROTEIN: hypothetical protein TorRG33x02_099550 [Trema orientale]
MRVFRCNQKRAQEAFRPPLSLLRSMSSSLFDPLRDVHVSRVRKEAASVHAVPSLVR